MAEDSFPNGKKTEAEIISNIENIIIGKKKQASKFPQGDRNPRVVTKPIARPVKVAYRASTTATTQSMTLSNWLLALRNCESGGTYTRNTGNGYYGSYQFMISTWNRVAPKLGRPDLVGIRPDLATPADQDFMVIGNANLSAGLVSQHPGCYRKLGLSNKPPKE